MKADSFWKAKKKLIDKQNERNQMNNDSKMNKMQKITKKRKLRREKIIVYFLLIFFFLHRSVFNGANNLQREFMKEMSSQISRGTDLHIEMTI